MSVTGIGRPLPARIGSRVRLAIPLDARVPSVHPLPVLNREWWDGWIGDAIKPQDIQGSIDDRQISRIWVVTAGDEVHRDTHRPDEPPVAGTFCRGGQLVEKQSLESVPLRRARSGIVGGRERSHGVPVKFCSREGGRPGGFGLGPPNAAIPILTRSAEVAVNAGCDALADCLEKRPMSLARSAPGSAGKRSSAAMGQVETHEKRYQTPVAVGHT